MESWKALIQHQRALPWLTVRRVLMALLVTNLPALSAQSGPTRLVAVRDLAIRGGENHLTAVSALTVSHDGTIAVFEPMEGLVRFFDRQGGGVDEHRRSSNGRHAFRVIGRYGWVADTLWVADAGTRRTSFIVPGGIVLRSEPMRQPLEFAPTSGERARLFDPSPRAIYEDGTRLMAELPARRKRVVELPRMDSDEPLTLVRLKADGSTARTLSVIPRAPVPECRARPGTGVQERLEVIPFCAEPLLAISEDGLLVAIAEQGNRTAIPSSFKLIVLNRYGDTNFARAYRYTPITITKAAADGAKLLHPDIRGLKVPPTYPPLRRVVIGRDGALWVELWTTAPVHRWLQLDARGNEVARVDLPLSVRVEAVAARQMWAVQPDSLDHKQDIVRFHLK